LLAGFSEHTGEQARRLPNAKMRGLILKSFPFFLAVAGVCLPSLKDSMKE